MCLLRCIFLQLEWEAINPSKKAKKKGYKNSGKVHLESIKVLRLVENVVVMKLEVEMCGFSHALYIPNYGVCVQYTHYYCHVFLSACIFEHLSCYLYKYHACSLLEHTPFWTTSLEVVRSTSLWE